MTRRSRVTTRRTDSPDGNEVPCPLRAETRRYEQSPWNDARLEAKAMEHTGGELTFPLSEIPNEANPVPR